VGPGHVMMMMKRVLIRARRALSPVDVGASCADAPAGGRHDGRRSWRGHPPRARSLLARLLAGTALVAAATLSAAAQDATWLATPSTGDFNTGVNWDTGTVPTGTASFNTSTTTGLSFSANTTVGGWTFNAGASAYTFTNGRIVQFNGAGIVVHGGSVAITNNFVLQFAATSTAGNATITNNDGLTFGANSTAGNATITNSFSGALSFINSGSAGSATVTNNNFLNFFDTSTAGSATITNNLFGILRFFGASSAGAAAITNGFGSLQFFDNSTAGAATITNNSGSLQFLDTSTAGSATIINNVGGSLSFNDSSTASAATITNNSGVVQFRDISTAGSAAITNNSSLQFLDTSTAGSAAITNNGSLAFFGTSTAGSATITTNAGLTRFLGDSSGDSARFITNAGGAFDISGLTAAGMTAGSIEGAGNYFLGSKQLIVGGNDRSTVVSGVIADGGASGGTGGGLVKVGPGTLTLSGANTYTGGTSIDGGVVIVDGSIASSILTTVNAGGTLGGNGTVGDTTIAGGTLSPGTSVGTLTVQGNLVMTAAAAYLVEVVGAAADRTNVSGTATLGGAVQVQIGAGGLTQTYTILHADGGLGGSTFGALTTTGLPPNFAGSLSYTGNDVILNLTAQLGAGTNLTVNQRNVASAINNFFNAGGALPPNFGTLFGLTGGNLANTLMQLSGEAATGAQQGAFQLGGQFLALMLDPFVDGRGDIAGAAGPALGFAPEREAPPGDMALAYAKAMKAPVVKAPPSFEQRWAAWGGAFGGYNRTDGDPAVIGSHDLTARAAGFAAGLDYRVAPGTVIGFALAGGGTNWSLAQGLGGGKSDAFQAGLYATTRSGPAYLAASLAFANYWMSTDRVAAFGDHLTARFNAQGIGARVEGGYRLGTPATGVTPYAALQAQGFRTPAYSETDIGGGGFGLTYNSRTATATRSELGARFDHVAAVDPTAVLTLRGRLAWAHDWVSDPALTAVFQALPGASFVVNGATPAKDAALASAGAELKLANGVTLSAKLDGEFANNAQTYAGTGALRVNW
jgi:autotransporter-associated beta strand protein